MKKGKPQIVDATVTSDKFSCKAPLIFSIPSDVYGDELERLRDRNWYLKIQKVQKKSEELREKLKLLTEKKFLLVSKTQLLIARSMSCNKKLHVDSNL